MGGYLGKNGWGSLRFISVFGVCCGVLWLTGERSNGCFYVILIIYVFVLLPSGMQKHVCYPDHPAVRRKGGAGKNEERGLGRQTDDQRVRGATGRVHHVCGGNLIPHWRSQLRGWFVELGPGRTNICRAGTSAVGSGHSCWPPLRTSCAFLI